MNNTVASKPPRSWNVFLLCLLSSIAACTGLSQIFKNSNRLFPILATCVADQDNNATYVLYPQRHTISSKKTNFLIVVGIGLKGTLQLEQVGGDLNEDHYGNREAMLRLPNSIDVIKVNPGKSEDSIRVYIDEKDCIGVRGSVSSSQTDTIRTIPPGMLIKTE